MDALEELAEALRRRLIARARAGAPADGGLAAEVRSLVDSEAPALGDRERDELAARVVRLATGLGPLEPLLADPAVDEVMVNGPGEVWVERGGVLSRVPEVRFEGEAALMHSIERILAPLGRRVDEASPLVDARLADGSRVNVVIPPLSLGGPCVTIRKFRRHGFSLDDLVANGTLAGPLASMLAACVRARASVLVSGGARAGGRTFLGAVLGAGPSRGRGGRREGAAGRRLRPRPPGGAGTRRPAAGGRGGGA